MPSPCGPASVGSFSTPAARITGVASKNANFAESSWSRPRSNPPTIATPERLMPASSARLCARPMVPASG
ncbi:Uncharacterised protein [Mycobacteroides abscessus subsp. abscessus]|nr:Uncharacterised protein [Mycobacteroides abscessus subsp. abscessus]